MIIDSSALLAIALAESDAEDHAAAIEAASARRMSAVSFFEASIIIDGRKGGLGRHDIDLLIRQSGIRIEAFDPFQARIARDAYRRYGRGNHAAGLNFADCCSYALARVRGEPLLYKGGDFGLTDIRSALAAPLV